MLFGSTYCLLPAGVQANRVVFLLFLFEHFGIVQCPALGNSNQHTRARSLAIDHAEHGCTGMQVLEPVVPLLCGDENVLAEMVLRQGRLAGMPIASREIGAAKALW